MQKSGNFCKFTETFTLILMAEEKSEKLIDYDHIETFIAYIRRYVPNAVELFTEGECIGFAMILKSVFRQGTIMFDHSHAVFKLHDRHYDITGHIANDKLSPNLIPFVDFGILLMDKWLKPKWPSSKNILKK